MEIGIKEDGNVLPGRRKLILAKKQDVYQPELVFTGNS